MADDTPVPNETTTDRGQSVVRVRRKKAAAPKDGAARSLDEVAKRHVARTDPEYYAPDAAVPPDENDPARRDRPTVSEVVLTPDAFPEDAELPEHVEAAREREAELAPPDLSDNKYRGLEDLNAMFAFDGSGQYFIAVTRILPKVHDGVACYGRQQNIRDLLSYTDFAERYGGGTYELIVYGPPARGKLLDKNGRPIPKALTRPVRLTVPWVGAGGYEPNPMSAIEHTDETEPQVGKRGPFEKAIDLPEALLGRRGNTLPEANMYARHLEHQETMDDRRRQDERESRERRRTEEQTIASVVAETKDQTIDLLRNEIAELKREQKNGHKNGTDMSGLAQVLASVRAPAASQEELERVRQVYEQQLRDQRETHAQRIQDAEERNRREREELTARLTREKDDATRRADLEVERATVRLAELERRLTHERDQERESARREAERVQTAHDRHLEALGREHQRDVDSVKAQYEARIGGLQDRMTSEARLLQQVHESTKQVEKTTVEAQLRTAEAENRRLENELARLKTELEKKGNLPKLLEEQDKVAAALGYVKESEAPGGGEDVDAKTMLLRGALALAQNLPEVIKQAGASIALARGAGGPPPGYAPGPRALPPSPYPSGGFSGGQAAPMRPPVTQAGPIQGYLPDDAGLTPPPLPPAYQQPQPALVPAVSAPPPPPSPLPPLTTSAPPPALQPTSPSGPPAVQPFSSAAAVPRAKPSAPPAPAPAQPPARPAIAIDDADIMKFAPDLEALFQASVQGKSLTELVDLALSINPGIALVAPSLSAERISAALRGGDLHTSPLVRRDGQRFLREFRDAVLARGVPSGG